MTNPEFRERLGRWPLSEELPNTQALLLLKSLADATQDRNHKQRYLVSGIKEIIGPAGIGKTTLVDQIESSCQAKNIPVIRFDPNHPENITNANGVVIADGFDSLALPHLLNASRTGSLVICTDRQPNPALRRIDHDQIKLTGFTEEETLLVLGHHTHFENSNLPKSLVYQFTSGHPALTMAVVEGIMQAENKAPITSQLLSDVLAVVEKKLFTQILNISEPKVQKFVEAAVVLDKLCGAEDKILELKRNVTADWVSYLKSVGVISWTGVSYQVDPWICTFVEAHLKLNRTDWVSSLHHKAFEYFNDVSSRSTQSVFLIPALYHAACINRTQFSDGINSPKIDVLGMITAFLKRTHTSDSDANEYNHDYLGGRLLYYDNFIKLLSDQEVLQLKSIFPNCST